MLKDQGINDMTLIFYEKKKIIIALISINI